jgi:hypothetical protein
MDCGLLVICKRGKRLSIWSEFCVWRIALWWHFGNIGRAVFGQEFWTLGGLHNKLAVFGYLTWHLLLDLGWQSLFSLLKRLWRGEGLCCGSSPLCTKSVPLLNAERLECEICPEVKDSCLNGVLNCVVLMRTLGRCFAATSVSLMQQLSFKHWIFINQGNTTG